MCKQRVESGKQEAQKRLGAVEEAEELAEVEAYGGEQGIDAVAGAALEPVAIEQAVVFGVADDRFGDGAALQFAFEFVGDAAFLSGDVNLRFFRNNAMAFVALIDHDAQRSTAHLLTKIG